MDVKEYDEIVRFHESKDSEQRNWPQDLLGQKMAKMLKGLIDRNEEERYRVVTVDDKVRLLHTVHKDPAAVTLEFIKRKRRWLNVTIGREWPQILQHLSSVSKAEQDAKKTSELHPVQALSNMLSVTFFLVTNSSVDEQPMLSQIQPTNLHSHEQTKQPSDQTLKCYASSNSFNEVKHVTKIASEELEFTICDTSCEAENELPMIQTNSGTQHFVMKSDFQQLLNGECFGDNEHLRLICKNLVKSGFFDVYIQGKRDGVFSSINPTELKSLFRKWPIINCKVVDAVQHFLYGIAIDEATEQTSLPGMFCTQRGSFGNMVVKTELYHIEPLRDNVTKSLAMDQPHIIFLETEYRNRTRTCGTPHSHTVRPDILSRQELLQLKEKIRRQTAGNLIVELVIVNDFSQYQKFGSNLETTLNRALDVVNGADSLYKPLGIRIVLVQAITWSSGNKIAVVSNSSALLDNFRVYAPSVTAQHDVTMLLTGTSLNSNVVGSAYVDAICTALSVGLVEDFGSLPAVSSTMAHEIGHLFSMQHDTGMPIDMPSMCLNCTCSQSTGCIMGAVLGSVVPNQWSSCSTQYLSTALGANHAYCLTNQPQSFAGPPVCGNGIQEGNEVCDCGSAMLAAGAQCTSGACCSNCRFVAYGTPCRASNGECDVAEVCAGCSSQCPADQYVQDGTSCGSGIGYCYKGSCPTRDNQCKAFYGSAGGDGISSCYPIFNPRGDVHGNCGPMTNSIYTACSAR
ncbi:hypothetical protein EMCRGX_G025501 [Ephydatia muelleri]